MTIIKQINCAFNLPEDHGKLKRCDLAGFACISAISALAVPLLAPPIVLVPVASILVLSWAKGCSHIHTLQIDEKLKIETEAIEAKRANLLEKDPFASTIDLENDIQTCKADAEKHKLEYRNKMILLVTALLASIVVIGVLVPYQNLILHTNRYHNYLPQIERFIKDHYEELFNVTCAPSIALKILSVMRWHYSKEVVAKKRTKLEAPTEIKRKKNILSERQMNRIQECETNRNALNKFAKRIKHSSLADDFENALDLLQSWEDRSRRS